jgi:hypothetical protein
VSAAVTLGAAVATLSHTSDRTPEALARRGSTRGPGNALGLAATYRLSVPVSFHVYDKRTGDYVIRKARYVWVSTAQVLGEWETYAFPAYSSGKVVNWGELPGSMKDTRDHHEVLERMGYDIAHSVARRNNGKRK